MRRCAFVVLGALACSLLACEQGTSAPARTEANRPTAPVPAERPQSAPRTPATADRPAARAPAEADQPSTQVPTIAGESSLAGSSASSRVEFTYNAPPGWTIRRLPGYTFEFAFEEPKDGFAASLNVADEACPLGLDAYAKAAAKKFAETFETASFEVADFQTDAGVQAKRYEADYAVYGLRVRAMGYLFDAGEMKLVLTGGCLPGDADRLRPVFDAAARSFKFTAKK